MSMQLRDLNLQKAELYCVLHRPAMWGKVEPVRLGQ